MWVSRSVGVLMWVSRSGCVDVGVTLCVQISRMNRKMSEKKTKESASKSRQSENQVTRVLLIVTFTFLVLVGFQCISQCFYMLMPKAVRQTEGSERDGHTERGGEGR